MGDARGMSGWQASHLRPPAPETGALLRLSYTQKKLTPVADQRGRNRTGGLSLPRRALCWLSYTLLADHGLGYPRPVLPRDFLFEKQGAFCWPTRARSPGESNPARRCCRPSSSPEARTRTPGEGVEPPIGRLTAGCLATWLPWTARIRELDSNQHQRCQRPSSCRLDDPGVVMSPLGFEPRSAG